MNSITLKLTNKFEDEYKMMYIVDWDDAEICKRFNLVSTPKERNDHEWFIVKRTKTHAYVEMPVSRALDVFHFAIDRNNGSWDEWSSLNIMYAAAEKYIREQLKKEGLL